MSFDERSEARFGVYVEALTGVLGHADRATPLRDYCTGLLMPAERKSVEPIAAVTAPARVAAQHQIAPAFRGSGAVVGYSRAHQGARPGPACDRARRAHRGLDHR